jgi:signal transduction histidine kinase
MAARAMLLVGAPLTLALILVTLEDLFEVAPSIVSAFLLVGLAVVIVMIRIGWRDLRTAEASTAAALDRAEEAEAGQRLRADDLARVLEASESLALKGDGQVDYLGVLAAMTPPGATSFLVRVDGGAEPSVAAAHGPLATSVVGVSRSSGMPAGHPQPLGEAVVASLPLGSYSASGRHVGAAVSPEHMAVAGESLKAALSVQLVDRNGLRIGLLHMLDPLGERVLEPQFVSLAHLVANQIAVAMENDALLARSRRQLLEVQSVQEQLVQASKLGAIGELAAAVAHEVNNPLTGILGFAELLLDEMPDGDPHHTEIAVIRDEAVRARTIVRALLEFARPRPPQRIPTDLNGLATSTLDLIQYRAQQAEVLITTGLGDLPRLELDPDALSQVLLNLFNNAIDAMPRGGELRVVTKEEGGRVCVSVADTGMGMDEATRDRIFTPFFSTRGTGGGTGLGLSVSLQIVQGHGGSISVDSTPGRGSTFSVWLPSMRPAFDGSVVVPDGTSVHAPADSAEWSAPGLPNETQVTAQRETGTVAAA